MQLGSKRRSVLPGWRHHCQHGFSRTVSSAQVEFECVIEAGGITDAKFQQTIFVRKSQLFSQRCFSSVQPSAVGADGVDLSVVGNQTKWLRQRPTWLRIGRIALMEDCEGAFEFRIAQIRVERRQLLRCQQSFVNYGSRGERTNVGSRRSISFHLLAQPEQE